MINNSITQSIQKDVQRYMVLNNRVPTITLGKKTFKDMTSEDIPVEDSKIMDGCVVNAFGYDCKIGDFDFGYQI